MNTMSHDIPNVMGADPAAFRKKMERLIPGSMSMGENGMSSMTAMDMGLPKNTVAMMTGIGPMGSIGMGGMFTVLKVRDELPQGYDVDPGWYVNPPGTVCGPVGPDGKIIDQPASAEKGKTAMPMNMPMGKTDYTCPMHPEVVSDKPGSCPKCGMHLVVKK